MKKNQICGEVPEINQKVPEINQNSKNNEGKTAPTQTNMIFYQGFSQVQTAPINLPFPKQFYGQNVYYCMPNAQMNWNLNSNHGILFLFI